MVYTQGKFSWGTKGPTHGPVMLLDYDARISLVTGDIIQNKFSLLRRRNSAPHCWATLTILPEKASLLDGNRHYTLRRQPSFIYSSWLSNDFIMLTGAKQDVEIYLRRINVLASLYCTEVILVDMTGGGNFLLRFDYHNLYHIKKPVTGMEDSAAWYHADCFDQLAQLGKHVSHLNKYFWTAIGPFGKNILRDLFDQINTRDPSRHYYQRLANLTSFHGFLSFLILQDTLISDFENSTPFCNVRPMYIMGFARLGGSGFVLNDVLWA
ncbi:hypothetical protein Fcan01_16168 [Folsomia candida]|uniref:Uncharacterized protein n=1 Tax=Folsomia candida TaxID=158441 RepID=A0A226DV69_FOLCA|nr:hypothetical protein Fcan01_16168 [Folsomia candida]